MKVRFLYSSRFVGMTKYVVLRLFVFLCMYLICIGATFLNKFLCYLKSNLNMCSKYERS